MKHDGPPITDAIEAFHAACEADGFSKGTLANQRSQGRKLIAATNEWQKAKQRWQPVKTHEFDGQLVTLYLARCKGGPGDRGNLLAFLKTFLGYLERQDWVKPGTKDKLTYGKKGADHYERKPKVYIDPERFGELIESQKRHPSDRATMALLLYTLCRKGELYALRWKHVDLVARKIKVYREKTDRWTLVGIAPTLYDELCDYQEWYAEEMDGFLDPEWHVLPRLVNHSDKDLEGRYYTAGVWYTIDPTHHPVHMEYIVKRGLDAIGIEDTEQGKYVNHLGEGAHTIRRSGARAMLKHLSGEQGYEDALTTVAAMLDHRDIKVTLRYIGMEKTKEALNEWLKTNDPYGIR